jgi:hypothetical protein
MVTNTGTTALLDGMVLQYVETLEKSQKVKMRTKTRPATWLTR